MEPKDLRLHEPAKYTIRVVGLLDERWSGYFGGLTFKVEPGGKNDQPITSLTGRMADQAALHGLLNALYEYHYPLLSVECQSCNEPLPDQEQLLPENPGKIKHTVDHQRKD